MTIILKKNFKKIFFWFLMLANFGVVLYANAQEATGNSLLGQQLSKKMRGITINFAQLIGFNVVSLPSVIALIVFVILSILSLLFIMLVFYGGYKWMMARGNEQEVEEARAIIRQAIIGLIVLLASYAFGYFILYFLITGGSGEGAPNTPYN